MESPKNIHISDYSYILPDERIAKYPLGVRDHSKLLVYRHGEVSEDGFRNLASYIPSGALMVFNNTKVIQARMHFRKDTGALIEIFLLEPSSPLDYEMSFQSRGRCSWYCLVGNLKKWKGGTLCCKMSHGNRVFTLSATRGNAFGASHEVLFSWDADDVTWAEIIDVFGELPIPPYLNRATEESDKSTYQTVYSKTKGSVAAPTAGLHFTDDVLKALDDKGVDREELTLHVGAGTFKPVKSPLIEHHEMHTEYFAVRRCTIERLLQHGSTAIAVGTTSVRSLESLYHIGVKLQKDPNLPLEQLHVSQWEPYESDATLSAADALRNVLDYLDKRGCSTLHTSTQIIIVPGYKYRIVKMLITNFHQPQSTLLLLVSALLGGDWRKVYDYALAHDFRFLSYGDSSLLIP